jgi:uncharacterized protein (TIGR00269 family)
MIELYDMFSFESQILVAVSGGKDSLALWDILNILGYKVDGLHINLGINDGLRYSRSSHQYAKDFADERGLKLHEILLFKDYKTTIPELTRIDKYGKEKPCSHCGVVKRHIMNRVAKEGGYDVLVTGHNLDDETSALLSNALFWRIGYLSKQSPVLPGTSGLIRKTKPLCRFSDREMAAYAFLREIEYIYDECPYASGAKTIYYKEVLNQLETDQPGTKIQFYLSFLRAKNQGFFYGEKESETQNMNPCKSCGQLTSNPEYCKFCQIIAKVS